MNRVDYALRYAEQGYRVLPAYVIKDEVTGKNKKVSAKRKVLLAPCAEHSGQIGSDEAASCRKCTGGHAGATTDERYIRWMWKQRPTALVAVVPPPGVLILDDDSHVFDDVWDTRPRVRSVSGKHHYWFRYGEGQEPIDADNGVQFTEPNGLVDIRTATGGLWIMAPCGGGEHAYLPENGWASAPARLPVLPQAVHERLLSAPREHAGGPGGPGVGKYAPGVEGARVGSAYDSTEGTCEALLERHGWTTEDGERWTRPGGTDGFGRLSESQGVWFFNVHTSNDEVLLGGHYYTASMLRCAFDFNNNWKACYLALFAEELNREREEA